MTEYMPATAANEIILLDPREILIDVNRNNRYGGHDQKYIKQMAKSLQEDGQLQPIVVRLIKPAPIAGGKQYEAVAGIGRLEASLLIRKKVHNWKIKAVVVDVNDEEALRYNVVENIHRANLTPIDRALAMKRFVEDHGWSQERVAKFFGVSGAYVSMLLAVIRLPKSIVDQVHKKQLTVDAAYQLTQIEEEKAKIIAPVPENEELAVKNRKERSAIIGTNAKRAAGKIVRPGLTSVLSLIETLMGSVQRESVLWYVSKAIVDYSEGRLSRSEAVCRIKDILN